MAHDFWFKIIGIFLASLATGALGHGAVATYPDRPFLRWKFIYKKDKKDLGWRDNKQTFLEGCEKLHQTFSSFAIKAGLSINSIEFSNIRNKISEILSLEADKEG